MPIEPILDEVELLHAIGARLEGLAEHHTKLTEELMATAGSVRNTATVLAVLVATKLRRGDGPLDRLNSTEAWEANMLYTASVV
jgi:hypothetical protein